MKRLMIAGTVGGLVLAAALTVATASSNDAAAQTTETSTAADVVETILDRLVASGLITQERADELAERIYASERYQRWAAEGLPEEFDEERLDRRLDRLAEAREKYGDLDREELRERWAEHRERRKDAIDEWRERRRDLGNSELREQLSQYDRDEIRDAIQNGTLDELLDTEAIADSMLERAEEALDRAVENGRITQDEADEKLAELDERLDDLRNGEVDLSETFKKRWRERRSAAEESGTNA